MDEEEEEDEEVGVTPSEFRSRVSCIGYKLEWWGYHATKKFWR